MITQKHVSDHFCHRWLTLILYIILSLSFLCVCVSVCVWVCLPLSWPTSHIVCSRTYFTHQSLYNIFHRLIFMRTLSFFKHGIRCISKYTVKYTSYHTVCLGFALYCYHSSPDLSKVKLWCDFRSAWWCIWLNVFCCLVAPLAVRCYSHAKVETDEEFDSRWVTYFSKPDLDAWELRKGDANLCVFHTRI